MNTSAGDLTPDVETFRPLFERNPREAAQKLVAAICKRHHVRHHVTDKMPEGTHAYVIPRDRVITLPPLPRDDDGIDPWLAVALHEIGHVVAPPCTRAEPHLHDRRSGGGYCLKCEATAWETAMSLWPFTDTMFRTLRESLTRAIMGVTATAVARADATRLIQMETLAADRLRRAQHETRLERQRLANLSVFADEVRSGRHACSTPVCRARAAMLDDANLPVCRGCWADRRFAKQRQIVEAMRARRTAAPESIQ